MACPTSRFEGPSDGQIVIFSGANGSVLHRLELPWAQATALSGRVAGAGLASCFDRIKYVQSGDWRTRDVLERLGDRLFLHSRWRPNQKYATAWGSLDTTVRSGPCMADPPRPLGRHPVRCAGADASEARAECVRILHSLLNGRLRPDTCLRDVRPSSSSGEPATIGMGGPILLQRLAKAARARLRGLPWLSSRRFAMPHGLQFARSASTASRNRSSASTRSGPSTVRATSARSSAPKRRRRR